MVAIIWSTFCMMLKIQIINRLRVVPLSLSPSCVTRKIMRKKWPPPEFHATFFFLAVFVRVTHDGQSEDTIMYPGLSFPPLAPHRRKGKGTRNGTRNACKKGNRNLNYELPEALNITPKRNVALTSIIISLFVPLYP